MLYAHLIDSDGELHLQKGQVRYEGIVDSAWMYTISVHRCQTV